MRIFVLIITVFSLVACQRSKTQLQLAEIERKIGALTERVDELDQSVKDDVADLDKRVKEAKELAELPPHERFMRNQQQLIQAQQQNVKGPDTEALAKITLPENPTPAQVGEYVRAVLAASGSPDSSAAAPQQQMLAKIGPQHLNILIDHLGTTRGVHGAQTYLLKSIEQLASPENKTLLIERLPDRPELLPLIEKSGWQADAREAILKLMTDGRTPVSSTVIASIAKMRDPKTYAALAEQLAISHEPDRVYDAIRDLPDIDLDDAVQRAWQRVKDNDTPTKARLAPIAISHGDKDALGAFIDLLDVSDSFELHRRGWAFLDRAASPRRTVLKHIDFHGSDAEITVWYEKNYHNLKFDKARKVFYVEGEPAAQEAAPPGGD